MKVQRNVLVAAALVGLLALTGCQTDSREQLLKTSKSQVELRSFQSRTFDTSNKERTLRTVIATLQDLSFVVDKADAVLGSVTASKLDHTTMSLPYQLRMTVTVRPRGVTQMIVRANATYNVTPVEDPEPYQQFFTALSKAMFLEANAAGGADYPAPQSAPRQTAAAPAPAPPVRSAESGKSNAAKTPAKPKTSTAHVDPSTRFVSKASRDAAYTQAKQDIEQKYERLTTTRRKERYGLGCDKSAKKARTQACHDVAFQIQLLQETKRKELESLERQYRQAIVRTPRARPVAAANAASLPQAAAQRKSRDEIIRNWRTQVEAIKVDGPYENCVAETVNNTNTDRLTECEERARNIRELRKEMDRALARLDGVNRGHPAAAQSGAASCPTGSRIDFSTERTAIKKVLSEYLGTSGSFNQDFREFKKLAEQRAQCGEIEVLATYTLESSWSGTISQYTRKAVLAKEDDRIYVVSLKK